MITGEEVHSGGRVFAARGGGEARAEDNTVESLRQPVIDVQDADVGESVAGDADKVCNGRSTAIKDQRRRALSTLKILNAGSPTRRQIAEIAAPLGITEEQSRKAFVDMADDGALMNTVQKAARRPELRARPESGAGSQIKGTPPGLPLL